MLTSVIDEIADDPRLDYQYDLGEQLRLSDSPLVHGEEGRWVSAFDVVFLHGLVPQIIKQLKQEARRAKQS